jgi:N6-adenosine-specific RNA methylase IME4
MTEISPLPDGEFDVIYADPPWSYNQDTPRGGVAHHYDTMDINDICDLDVPAAENSILYLWTTVTHAQEAFNVMDEWGFDYKTQAVWDKQNYGIGHWFRGGHELLYLCVKGDVSPPDADVRRESIFREKSGKHSSKPDKVREYIERAHPDARKLELFSRDGRVGWTMWGDETPNNQQDKLKNYK